MKCPFKLALLLFVSCSGKAQKKSTISANNYEKATQSKPVQLVDERWPDEYNDGHIKGAV